MRAINIRAFALAVRPEIAAPTMAGLRALVPVKPEPREAVVDDVEKRLAVAFLVRVLDAQDEHAAGMARIKPVKQRGARTADVEEPRWTRGKTNADFGHGF